MAIAHIITHASETFVLLFVPATVRNDLIVTIANVTVESCCMRPVFVQPVFVKRVFAQSFSSNPIRLGSVRLA